jgi:hypothetical protein
VVVAVVHEWEVVAVAAVSAEAVVVPISVAEAVISADARHRCRGHRVADPSTCRAAAGNPLASFLHQAQAAAPGRALGISHVLVAVRRGPTREPSQTGRVLRAREPEVRQAAIN